MQRNLMVTVSLTCFFLMSFGQAQDAKQVVAKAQIWPYVSICKFPDTNNWPSSITFNDASMTVTGCSDLEKKLGHPSAVRVTVINLGDSDVVVPIKGLGSVLLNKKDGKKQAALGWRYRDRSPMGSGYTTAFASNLEGQVDVTIAPENSCDFIFLFPKVEVGESINFGGTKSVKITD